MNTSASRGRRCAALAGVATLTAATLAAGAPGASAASQSITGATLSWGVQDYIQYTGTGAGCHFLSAGSLDSTTSASMTSSYKTTDGNVAILRDTAIPLNTYAERCSGFTPISATPLGAPANQRAVWGAGTGTRDSVTGASTVAFLGTLSMKYSGQAIRIVDPVLTLDANGDGALTATTKVGATEAAAVVTDDVVLAEFDGVNVAGTTGYTALPTFFGRTITIPAGTPATPTEFPTATVKTALGETGGIPNWGSFPQSFLSAIVTGGDASRFYNTNSTGDAYKDASAVTVSYGTLGSTPPGDGEQAINVVVPETSESCDGDLIWAIKAGEDGTVTLTAPTLDGDHLSATGDLDPITVTDSRTGGAACIPFTISGQVSDFTGDAGTLPGNYLGWTPNSTGAALSPAAPVPSGFGTPMGPGLSQSALLVTTVPGSTPGTADAGADLELQTPVDADPGAYTSTLTLTGLS